MNPQPRYTLAADGDSVERNWSEFAQSHWPAYEEFWRWFVVPLTLRPDSIDLRPDVDPDDAHDARLHYSALSHVAEVFDMLGGPPGGLHDLRKGITGLGSALDNADQLLARRTTPGRYELDEGGKARQEWRTSGRADATRGVRDYRNWILHDPIGPEITTCPPGTNEPQTGGSATWRPSQSASAASTRSDIQWGGGSRFPKIGRESAYADWREASVASLDQLHRDFATTTEILDQAWNTVIIYLQAAWETYLLPKIP